MKHSSNEPSLPSSSSSHSKKRKMLPRSDQAGKTPPQELPELSDVPCYTCRRRHVKCDRTLPHCAKCAKKGVACLGYRKPLRWADGVAVRGKLRGRTQPVVDSQAISIARENVAQSVVSVQEEAEHLGLHATEESSSDAKSNLNSLQELINYHNTIICAEQFRSDLCPKLTHRIAPLSPELVQGLPQDILNCILGNAAVHMAARNPGNRAIERMALETKVKLFQGINKLVTNPQEHRPDVLLCCIALLFAMDVIEHGVSRWQIHFAGALKLLKSIGGPEYFVSVYPHLKFSIVHIFYFKSMCILFSPESVMDTQIATRKGIEAICFNPDVKKVFFISCPRRLMLDIYDLEECASNISRAHGYLSLADVYKREWILTDVLQFEPETATHDLQADYFSHRQLTPQEKNAWDLVFSSWRCAIILVVLRHLYFGVRNPELPPQLSRSTTPKVEESYEFEPTSNQPNTDFPSFTESQDSYSESGRLLVSNYLTDPISRTPSPLYASLSLSKSFSLDTWARRYEIHNEAFVELFNNLSALSGNFDPSYLRYVIAPLTILGFLSRPNSRERALCQTLSEQFDDYIAKLATSGKASPIGGGRLEFNIPWDELDAYSKEIENEQEAVIEIPLYGSACEWNWGNMLKTVKSTILFAGPLAAGTMHMEFGTEVWAFNALSNLLSAETLVGLAQSPSTPTPSASA